MKAEIITVGTELLLGQIINTNATYLAQELAELGCDVYYQTTVGDNQLRLLDTLKLAESRSDLVLICGGLGPTEDDLTKETVALHVDKSIVYDEEAMSRLLVYFEGSQRPMTENNKQQAETIEGSITLQNPAGLACGSFVTERETSYLLLPGPPRELKAMFVEEARPLLEARMPNIYHLTSRYLRYLGIGESQLVTDLKQLIENQTNPTLAPYAKSNEVMLRLTAQTKSPTEAKELLDEMEQTIQGLVGDYFYGYGEETTIEEATMTQLYEQGKTISIVETTSSGVALSRVLATTKGLDVCAGGVVLVPYKETQGLLPGRWQGNVSQKITSQLAESGLKRFETDYCLSIMGETAGETSRGQIYISLASKTGIVEEKRVIRREKDYIIDGMVKHGLNLLRKNSK